MHAGYFYSQLDQLAPSFRPSRLVSLSFLRFHAATASSRILESLDRSSPSESSGVI